MVGHPHLTLNMNGDPASAPMTTPVVPPPGELALPSTQAPEPPTDGAHIKERKEERKLIPPNMVDAGWCEVHSVTQGKSYFYNKFTRETLWDLPSSSTYLREQRMLQPTSTHC